MADVKVTDMSAATSVNSADVLYCVQSNTDKQLSVSTLLGNLPNTPLKVGGLFVLASPVQQLNGAGVITVTQTLTLLTSQTGATNALTINNGTIDGQIKLLVHTNGVGTNTLSGGNVGATSIEFNRPGHTAQLMWQGNKWWVIGGTATITI